MPVNENESFSAVAAGFGWWAAAGVDKPASDALARTRTNAARPIRRNIASITLWRSSALQPACAAWPRFGLVKADVPHRADVFARIRAEGDQRFRRFDRLDG